MNRCNSCRAEVADLCLSGRCEKCCTEQCNTAAGHQRTVGKAPELGAGFALGPTASGRYVLTKKSADGVEMVLIYRMDSGVAWCGKDSIKHLAPGASVMVYPSRKGADNAVKVHGGTVTPDTDIL